MSPSAPLLALRSSLRGALLFLLLIRKALWLFFCPLLLRFKLRQVFWIRGNSTRGRRFRFSGHRPVLLHVDLQGGTELAIFDELWPLRLAQRLQEAPVKGLSLPRGPGQVEVGLVALEDALQGGLADSTSYCLSITLFGQCFPLSASNTCRFKIFRTMCSSSVYLPGKCPATRR